MAIKTLTKGQWAEIEKQLSSRFGSVKLLIDGYPVSLVIEHSKMRLYIAVYVNGQITVKKCIEDSEERRRFYQPKTSFAHTAKFRAAMNKIGKSRVTKDLISKEERADFNRTITTYQPYWTTFKPLKRHLEANNDSIELFPEET